MLLGDDVLIGGAAWVSSIGQKCRYDDVLRMVVEQRLTSLPPRELRVSSACALTDARSIRRVHTLAHTPLNGVCMRQE